MFKAKEDNKLKIAEIRLSPELLRITSRASGGIGMAKIILILIIALLLMFYKDLVNILKDKYPDERLVLVSMVILFLAALTFTIYQMSQNSGKTLIITEKGLFIEPKLAEFWKDIAEYHWHYSTEAHRDLFFGQSGETSLLLYNNKDAWPKTINLLQYGFFFTADQVQQMDGICNRLGIKKLEG